MACKKIAWTFSTNQLSLAGEPESQILKRVEVIQVKQLQQKFQKKLQLMNYSLQMVYPLCNPAKCSVITVFWSVS